MEVLDTNVIIRYLTQDEPEHSKRAREVFESVESGQRTLFLSEAVVVETVQVLSSKVLYNLPRQEIRLHLNRLIRIPEVKLSHKKTLTRALEVYVHHTALSFVDSLCIAHAERQGNIPVLSFDDGYDKKSVQENTLVRRKSP